MENGKIPLNSLAVLPISWSSNGFQEYLTHEAAASFSRMINHAVAATGGSWGINDAYRPYSEQERFFRERYRAAHLGGRFIAYKYWNGVRYGQLPNTAVAAVPGTSNHGKGLAIDLGGAAIQNWLRTNCGLFGWVRDVLSEPWHFSYLKPQNDQYRSEGALNHGWVQERVGAKVDGAIGPETVKRIRAFQKANGLTPDGIVGPATRKKLGSGDITSTPYSGTAGVSVESEDPFMALSADQAKSLFDRIFGMLVQRHRTATGKTPVDAKTPGAIPCRVLDDLDGQFIVDKIDALGTKVDALAKKVG